MTIAFKVAALVLLVGIVLCVNVFLDNPTFELLSDQADFEMRSNDPESAENSLQQLIMQNFSAIENHYNYIQNHFEIPEKKRIRKRQYKYRDDETIKNHYNFLAEFADPIPADIGHFGKGLLLVKTNDYHPAISAFLQVKNTQLCYLNNLIGETYQHLDSTKLAEKYFRKEIANNGNLSDAYANLFVLLYDQGRKGEVVAALDNPEIKIYVPIKLERAIHLESFQLRRYLQAGVKSFLRNLNIWGAVAALMILCSWVLFLRKLDIYEVEKWKHVTSTVLLGMIFSLLTFPLSDSGLVIFGLKLNGNLINDFIYTMLSVGIIEEFVKIVPLLLMLKYTKAVNEPFDYILFASMSALGFAFMQNLQGLSTESLHLIHGTALTTTVIHMFHSSIIAYGMVLNKYKRQKNQYWNFICFFSLAAILHGFFDFLMLNDFASNFTILYVGYLIVSLAVWNSFISNTLNHSVFYDKEKILNNQKLQDFIVYALSAVFVFEYVALAFTFCPQVANMAVLSSLRAGTFLIGVLALNLSSFSITKGQWAKIRYLGIDPKISFETLVGQQLIFTPFTENASKIQFLPNTGTITRQITVSDEPNWYVIKLEHAQPHSAFLADTILIKTLDRESPMIKSAQSTVGLYLIPVILDLEQNHLVFTDFIFEGWAMAE